MTILAGLIVGSIQLLVQCRTYRSELAIKYTPTVFPWLRLEEKTILEDKHWQWSAPSDESSGSFDREGFVEHRHEWQRLGRGFEGETFQYDGSVVKVFLTHNAPFRNCVPGTSPELRWPTEISASLILGGQNNDGREHINEDATFLPVTDYFLSPETDGQKARWHFLTPFLPSGGLPRLAKRLREEDTAYTAQDLDVVFRSSLDRLLGGLDEMHTGHELCHDDVKLDNIFVDAPTAHGDETEAAPNPNETTHWLLGDLGNVREIEHPYHSSLLWLASGKNLADCRANDVVRLLKVYMQFLRQSVSDKASFDRELFRGAEPWSALFWSVWAAPRGDGGTLSATKALDMSQNVHHPLSQPDDSGLRGREVPELDNTLYRLVLGERRILSWATGHLLNVKMGEGKARWWALVPFLGMPYAPCQAATS